MICLSEHIAKDTFPVWGTCSFQQERLLPVRSRSRIPENAAGIIVFLFGYYTEDYPERNVSRYAIADDYHAVLLPKLNQLSEQLAASFAGHAFIPFVDASPIDEVEAASRAGLGEVGRNGLLLNRQYGSYCFIGEIVTTLPLENAHTAENLCTRCDRCLKLCPTGALSSAGFCKEKCRSHITQKKGILTSWEQEQVKKGGFVWGCDCCVDACPVNLQAQKSSVPEFYQNRVPLLDKNNLETVLSQKSYCWRGHTVLLRNLSLFDENAERRISESSNL